MARDDIPASERLLELGGGMAIYRVHLDRMRERDVNARVMDDSKFRRLVENIKEVGEFESLPLLRKVQGQDAFDIISGHHRTRAARTAGLMTVPCLVIERELTDDEVTAKQLAHNALAGHDDADLLRELYNSMSDINARLHSGLTEMELKQPEVAVPTDALDFEFDFEPIYILFMASGNQRFMEALDRLEKDVPVLAADKADFDAYVKMVNQVSKREDIRNIAGIMGKIIGIVNAHYKAQPAPKKG
jgi:uncharacterized ParB-like nuclease family protein